MENSELIRRLADIRYSKYCGGERSMRNYRHSKYGATVKTARSSEDEGGKKFQWRYHCAQSDYTDLNFTEAGIATIRRVIIHGQPARRDRGAGCRVAAACASLL